MRRFLSLQPTKTALSERFEQILDQKISNAYISDLNTDDSLKIDAELQEQVLAAKTQSLLQDASFKQKYQKEIAFTQSDLRLRLQNERRDADPYFNKPWNGTEQVTDTARRMIIDSMPKPKKTDMRQPAVTSKVVLVTERIQSAKELSLDYKVGKVMSPEEKERRDFQEMYKERLLGPSMFLNSASSSSTIGLITSMADARINAEIDQKTGTFKSDDMRSVRGKPLDKDRLANSADTAYFMNEVLKKQDCLPTWIESQQSVDVEIRAFRLSLYDCALRNAIELIDADGPRSIEDTKDDLLKHDKDTLKQKVLEKVLRTQKDYLASKISDINSKIRSYNLQSPSSTLHKWKLVRDKELSGAIDKMLSNLESELTKARTKQKTSHAEEKNNGLLGVLGGGKSSQVNVSYQQLTTKPEPMNFWHLVKMIFRG